MRALAHNALQYRPLPNAYTLRGNRTLNGRALHHAMSQCRPGGVFAFHIHAHAVATPTEKHQ
jgi:hypothetical protein